MANPKSDSENIWVDERLASLSPSSEWRPDSGRAFERLLIRKSKDAPAKWIRLSLAATIVAGISLVFAVLPWPVFWKSVIENRSKVAEPAKFPHPATIPVPIPLTKPGLQQTATIPNPSTAQGQALPAQGASQTTASDPSPALEPAPAVQSGPRVTSPEIISKVEPDYTDEARRQHIQGIVVMQCTIGIDGTAKVDKIVQGLGFGLDENAVKAIEASKFRPGMIDGQPVKVSFQITSTFKLN